MKSSSHIAGFAALTLISVIMLLYRLGDRDLWAPDEPRYAQVAEEIRTMPYGARSLVVMHLNGEVYTQKPPLYLWLEALAGSIPGRVTETAARLPSALAGIGLVLLTAWFGRRLFGDAAALLGGGLLLTAHLFLHIGRRAQLDMLLALLETLALVSFWCYAEEGRQKRGLLVLLHLSMGLAMLVKGPVGFLIPALIMVIYLAGQRRWQTMRQVFPWWSFLLSLGPSLIWLAAVLLLTPAGFFQEAVVDNIFSRFAEGTSHVRPFYYFLYQFPADFLPWTLVWLFCWKGIPGRWNKASNGETGKAWRFLLVWVVVTLVFFSISAGKRGLYLIPMFPAAALLTADAVWAAWKQARVPKWVFAVLPALLAGVSLVLGLAVCLKGSFEEVVLPQRLGVLLVAIGVLGIAGLVAAARRGSGAGVLATMLLVAGAMELVTMTLLFAAVEADKSPRPIAEAANRATAPDEAIALISKHTLMGGLLYYGDRRVADVRNMDQLKAFHESGGRVVVGHPSIMEELYAAHFEYEVLDSFRKGHRRLCVMKISPRF